MARNWPIVASPIEGHRYHIGPCHFIPWVTLKGGTQWDCFRRISTSSAWWGLLLGGDPRPIPSGGAHSSQFWGDSLRTPTPFAADQLKSGIIIHLGKRWVLQSNVVPQLKGTENQRAENFNFKTVNVCQHGMRDKKQQNLAKWPH